MKHILSSILLLLATGCAFEFESSIEPLVFPTMPPQPFGSPAPSAGTPHPLVTPGQEIAKLAPVAETPIALPSIDLSDLSLALLGGGLIGTLASLFFSFHPLRFSGAQGVCMGAVVAGILGFSSLFAVDFGLARAAGALAAAGPVGIVADLVFILPIELVVIDLHIGFALLA